MRHIFAAITITITIAITPGAHAQSFNPTARGGAFEIDKTLYATRAAAGRAALEHAQQIARRFGSRMRVVVVCPRGGGDGLDDIMFLSSLSQFRDSVSVRIERGQHGLWRVRRINERDVRASDACRGEMIGG